MICEWNLFSTFEWDFVLFEFSCWRFVSHPVEATDLVAFWHVLLFAICFSFTGSLDPCSYALLGKASRFKMVWENICNIASKSPNSQKKISVCQ